MPSLERIWMWVMSVRRDELETDGLRTGMVNFLGEPSPESSLESIAQALAIIFHQNTSEVVYT